MDIYFITGTDTDAGKTVAACGFVQYLVSSGRKVAVMKPVASGCEMLDGQLKNSDALALMKVANIKQPYEQVNPYTFEPAIAPHIAAAEKDVEININKLQKTVDEIRQTGADALVIEGAGGWQLPLSNTFFMPELVEQLSAKVILTVGLKLGCLNHALLSAQSIQASGCELAGWVAVQTDETPMPRQKENLETLIRILKSEPIATLPYMPGWQSQNFADKFSLVH
ncbi:dethiobiotin synthase [Idiomarina piscisalsi]|uniref:dethiobiotin synthase n=1 Tax=Idiomarina piscisalsi TaxID=1096243 RepID=UPI0013833702|nr:dethiobiotin synthase [Idiomarina piscisalsi]MTJ01200.1 dethiobiotin synthase [Idiomarina piscisalsi]